MVLVPSGATIVFFLSEFRSITSPILSLSLNMSQSNTLKTTVSFLARSQETFKEIFMKTNIRVTEQTNLTFKHFIKHRIKIFLITLVFIYSWPPGTHSTQTKGSDLPKVSIFIRSWHSTTVTLSLCLSDSKVICKIIVNFWQWNCGETESLAAKCLIDQVHWWPSA